MVKARRPGNGFSAATTEEVSSVAAPAMSATRFAKEVMCMRLFIRRVLQGTKQDVGGQRRHPES